MLIIGGTRFSGLYLFKELHDRVRGADPPSLWRLSSSHPKCQRHTSSIRTAHPASSTPSSLQGHSVTLFNRGKTPNRPVPGESKEAFEERIGKAQFVQGDRTNVEVKQRQAGTARNAF